jgi:hypothetical protein
MTYLSPSRARVRMPRRLLLVVVAAAACSSALAVTAAPANAYYEQFFCEDAYLPAGSAYCRGPEYHHLQLVNANAYSGSAYVCARTVDSNLNFNSQEVCADGYISKNANGLAGFGVCRNGEGYAITMDYCVQKF